MFGMHGSDESPERARPENSIVEGCSCEEFFRLVLPLPVYLELCPVPTENRRKQQGLSQRCRANLAATGGAFDFCLLKLNCCDHCLQTMVSGILHALCWRFVDSMARGNYVYGCRAQLLLACTCSCTSSVFCIISHLLVVSV